MAFRFGYVRIAGRFTPSDLPQIFFYPGILPQAGGGHSHLATDLNLSDLLSLALQFFADSLNLIVEQLFLSLPQLRGVLAFTKGPCLGS